MKHLLLLFVVCLSFQANAQDGWSYVRDPNAKGPIIWHVSGMNDLTLHVRGLPGYLDLAKADVIIVSRKDTITLVASERGIVYCDALLADSVWVKVSYKDYETVEGKIKSRSSYEIYLKEKTAEKKDVVANDGAIQDTVKHQSGRYPEAPINH